MTDTEKIERTLLAGLIEALRNEVVILREVVDHHVRMVEKLTAERDAIIRASYYREGPDAFYGCDVLGSASGRRYRSEAEIVNEIRKAAGLGPIPTEAAP